jgi:hypothetical protein
MNIFIGSAPREYHQGTVGRIIEQIRNGLAFAVSREEAVSAVLLQSPDGSVYSLSVDDAGSLVTTAVPLGTR